MSYQGFGNTSGITVSKNIIMIDTFKGVDLTSAPSNVNISRSPEAPNMIRDVPGKVRKRLGYHLTGTYSGTINGVYMLNDKQLVHAGTKLYYNNTAVYSDMNDARGRAWQIDGKLYIVDGKTFLIAEESENTVKVKKATDDAFIPTIYVGKSPDGSGGSNPQAFNLLSTKWKESFLGNGTSTDYQLSVANIDSAVIVKQMDAKGNWNTVDASKYTVDKTNGLIKFKTAPEKPPAAGQPNIEIQASSAERAEYADTINKCSISIVFGQNGSMDTLFLSGNPDMPNRDFHSDYEERTYFRDDSDSIIGNDDSEIIGYSIINNYLATHKNSTEDGRNIFMRYSSKDDTVEVDKYGNKVPLYRIMNTVQGEGAIGKHTFAYINEPLFATKRGIFAVTSADITGEKYTQNRSFYINKALESEDLSKAYVCAWKDFYVIATSNRVYLLDTLQKNYEKNTPYSTFQYECYYWEIKNISAVWSSNNILSFGTTEGKTYSFYTDAESVDYYNDNGKAIAARWDIPDLDGKNFFKNKTFRYMSVKIAPAITCGFSAYALSRGTWTKLFNTGARSNYFDFSYIDFGKINFSSDTTPRTLGSKIKVKKVDRARFSIRNEEKNEPLEIYEVAFEYTQGGNFKG